jgi:glycine cleavage system H protein
MSRDLLFRMGEFQAYFPVDRMYAENHMWARRIGDHFRFGFTAYAVRLMQDVYFLDWVVDQPSELRERQEIGALESKKAEASLYAPIAGTLTVFNEELLADPSAINLDKYGTGWLFEIKGKSDSLMTPQQYVDYLDSVWEATQRTIKGQLH